MGPEVAFFSAPRLGVLISYDPGNGGLREPWASQLLAGAGGPLCCAECE